MIKLFKKIDLILKFINPDINKIIAEYACTNKIKLVQKYATSILSFLKITDNKIFEFHYDYIKILNLSDNKILDKFDIQFDMLRNFNSYSFVLYNNFLYLCKYVLLIYDIKTMTLF